MTSSVEDEIVSMKFENTQFEKAASVTLSTLDKLRASLHFPGAGTGISNLQGDVNRFSLHPVENAISGVSTGFLTMATIAITALSNIVNRAVDAGLSLTKSLSITPIMDGFREYELKMGSIQTILANTDRFGTTLEQVTHNLDELNEYADKTIYNFGAMTKNIGLFTNAGIRIEDATSMIKGFSNAAAASGTDAQGAAHAAYQLSQALSAGTVRLMDWRSLQNVGMGNKNMQQSLVDLADAMGIVEKKGTSSKEIMSSFNASLEKNWLTADVMSSYLKIMAGDMTKAEMAALGLDKAQIKAFKRQQQIAEDAATKVRTLTQLMSTLKESVGSSWAETFTTLFGDFNEATDLFTNINSVIGGFIGANADARNKVLKNWAELGGRTMVLRAIETAFEALISVIKPIGEAFREIFPRKTANDLMAMTKSFMDFTLTLKIGAETQENLKRTFAGLFAVIDIGWKIVKGIFGVFGDLFGVVGEGSEGFLEFTGSVGDLLVKFNEAIERGNGLTAFFDGLSKVLAFPIRLLQSLAGLISDVFSNMDTGKLDGASDSLKRVGDRLSPIEALLSAISDAWDRFMDKVGGMDGMFTPIIDAFANLGNALADAIAKEGFGGVMDIINTTLLGGILLMIGKFVANMSNITLGGGILANISGTFGELRDVMQSFQTQIQAKTLMLIAGAIALLTASVLVLSLIDPKKLTKALLAMSVGFGQLLGGMKLLTLATAEAGFIKMPIMAASMILLATSIVILSAAVAIMSRLSWEELAKGLSGVVVLLLALSTSATLLSSASGPILRAGLAMIPLAIGLNLLAVAMKIFATMSWEEMGKGMTGVAGGLLIIAGAMNLMPATLPITAVGLVLVAAALGMLAGTMKIFATMSWEEMGKGMTGIAGGLLIIAAAMNLMPPTLPITAAGLLILAGALAGIAGVAKIFATMSWEEMGKAAAGLAGALLIIAGGLALMSGTLMGSAALLVASAALAVLAPVLVILGNMSWESIAKGLSAIAGVFVILGLAGLILGPLVPVILGLSAAMLIFGAGLALAGAGALALSLAFSLFVATVAGGTAVIVAAIQAVIELLPDIAVGLVAALEAFAVALQTAAPEIGAAWVAIMTALLDGMIKLTPKVAKTLYVMIKTGLALIRSLFPDFLKTGLDLIIRFLEGMAKAMPQIVDAAVDVSLAFLAGIVRNYPKLVQGAFDAIIKFINALSKAIDNNSEELGKAGGNLAVSLVKGIVTGIVAAVGQIKDAIVQMVKDAAKSVDAVGIIKDIVTRSSNKRVELVGVFKDLIGGTEEVKNSLGSIKDQIKATLEESGADIDKFKNKIKQLEKGGVTAKEAKALKSAKKALAEAKELNAAAEEAQKAYDKQLKRHGADLKTFAKLYDKIAAELAIAQDELEKKQAAMASFKDSVMSTFNVKPDISATTSLRSYMRDIEKQTQKIARFKETLKKLKDAGLDDASYRQLIAQGLDAQKIMDQLLAGGTGAIDAFDAANIDLESMASSLADMGSFDLGYTQGVDTAQGIVNGLEASLSDVEKAMTKIAKLMMKAIRKELDIKSPSRKMALVGKQAVNGLLNQMDSMSSDVERTSAAIGKTALDTIQSTLAKIGDDLPGTIDISPMVTPVLDLTQLAKDATQISSLMAANPIKTELSFAQASDISRSRQAATDDYDPNSGNESTRDVVFEQTIISPKPVDDIEVYRGTRSLLSLAKEELNV